MNELLIRQAFSYDSGSGVITRKIDSNHRWRAGTIVGSHDHYGYLELRFGDARYKAHRLAWFLYHGEWPNDDIDHINGVRDDNRIVNLRVVSNSENCKNRSKPKHNTSGHVGVTWDKSVEGWRTRISVNKKVIFLGVFEDKEKAIAVRKKAEVEHGFHPNHGREQAAV